MGRPIITSIPVMSALVGRPYVYQVTAIPGGDTPMEQLRLAMQALNTALDTYDATLVQITTAVNSQMIAVRDAINDLLPDTNISPPGE